MKMKAKNIIIVLILLSFNIFCTQESENKEIIEKDLKISKIINLDSNINCYKIIKIDSKYIFLKINDKSAFYLSVNINKSTEYKKIVPKGKGPNEFLFPIYVENRNNKLLFYDTMKKILFELKNQSTISILKKFEFKYSLPTYWAEIDSNTFISSGLFHEGRFGIIDKNKNLIKQMGYYPVKDSLIVDNYCMFNVSQAKIKVNPGNNKLFAVIAGGAELIEIFKFKKETTEFFRINSIDINNAVLYENTQDQMKYIKSSKNKLRFSSPCVTEDNIYVLYLNFTLKEGMKDGSKFLCKEVRVFDWKANLVKKYFLEKGAKSIYVFDNKLYALGMDENYKSIIYVYDL